MHVRISVATVRFNSVLFGVRGGPEPKLDRYRKDSEILKDCLTSSVPVIQHPELPDMPTYKVQVLQPVPSPLSPSASHLSANDEIKHSCSIPSHDAVL